MRRRTISAFLCAAVVMVGAPAIGAVTVNSASTYEWQIVVETNAQRVSHGKVATRGSGCAKDYAIKRARWMRDHRKLKHSDLSTVMRACHFTRAAENIAMGYPNGEAVVRAWMNSSGHRANILNSKYTRLGTGARRDSRGVWWSVEIFGR
ncbi:CAP domain-containing protein [Aeromicrobium terrae]|uniref:CAP domain-containing protein n=1 Tax=Aeromicrobium terrae TaxID=2498846 RepID=A0A5C8NQS4_9ACTN|nr:CAP domain-containing protein [Aeromicrobium terrae]TXL63231.1 CAP domain-containing protein [Aeromicrobium terrae]